MAKQIALLIPSYRGITDPQARALIHADELETIDDARVDHAVMRKVAVIDVARNELFAFARHAAPEAPQFWQDDDVETELRTIRTMIRLADAHGFDVLTAPYQQRGEVGEDAGAGDPAIRLHAPPITLEDGSLVAPCAAVPLGCTLLSPRACAVLADTCRPYRALLMRDQAGKPLTAWNVFGSATIAARELFPDAPDGALDEYRCDDMVFSHRARKAGLKLWAYLHSVTNHAGMGRYCYADDYMGGGREVTLWP